MDLSLMTNEGRLNIRVAAVITDGDKILVEQGDCVHFAVCPGGRINFGETAENAIVREIYEELGVRAKIARPLYVHQNFFGMDGKRNHELCFFFLLETGLSACKNPTIKGRDNASTYSWVSFDELQHIPFYPLFLKKTIYNLPQIVELIAEIDNSEVQ